MIIFMSYIQQVFTLGKGQSAEADGWINFVGLWRKFITNTQGMMHIGVCQLACIHSIGHTPQERIWHMRRAAIVRQFLLSLW